MDFKISLFINIVKYKNTSVKYIINQMSKEVNNSKLIGEKKKKNILKKKKGTQFNNTPLVLEQNNCTAETINVYIVYNLNYWPRIPLRNLKLKKIFLWSN